MMIVELLTSELNESATAVPDPEGGIGGGGGGGSSDRGMWLRYPRVRVHNHRVPYPLWSYYPRNARPEQWAVDLCTAVAAHADVLDTREPPAAGTSRATSNEVLESLRPAMEKLGYLVETGKSRHQRIERPVLFGENGLAEVTYAIDAFHDHLGIAVEVEAGRGAMSNAAYRDIIRASLLLDAEYFVLMMPISYRYQNSEKTSSTEAYLRTRDQLSAIYASERLRLPFKAVLLVGY